jgi:hypothetical protein
MVLVLLLSWHFAWNDRMHTARGDERVEGQHRSERTNVRGEVGGGALSRPGHKRLTKNLLLFAKKCQKNLSPGMREGEIPRAPSPTEVMAGAAVLALVCFFAIV